MTIIKKTPITLAEVKTIVEKLEEKKELQNYLKKFTKLSKDKADKLMEEVEKLDSPKIKKEHVIKLADLLPKDNEDINKIFADGALSEKEINAILQITEKY